MIFINKVEDLKKYKIKATPFHKNGIKRVVVYEFKENGKLADVVFNTEIPFGIHDLLVPIKVHLFKGEKGKAVAEDIKELNVPIFYDAEDDFLPDIEYEEMDCYSFVANNIVANKKFRVGLVYANALKLNDDSEIHENLDVKTKIEATKLNCDMVHILCGEIVCDELICENITCRKLQAKTLETKHNHFQNIIAENVNNFYELPKDSNSILYNGI